MAASEHGSLKSGCTAFHPEAQDLSNQLSNGCACMTCQKREAMECALWKITVHKEPRRGKKLPCLKRLNSRMKLDVLKYDHMDKRQGENGIVRIGLGLPNACAKSVVMTFGTYDLSCVGCRDGPLHSGLEDVCNNLGGPSRGMDECKRREGGGGGGGGGNTIFIRFPILNMLFLNNGLHLALHDVNLGVHLLPLLVVVRKVMPSQHNARIIVGSLHCKSGR